jgi:hypothetical protein
MTTSFQPYDFAVESAVFDSRKVCGVLARTPDGERLALIAAIATPLLALFGCFVIGGFSLPLAAILGGALILAALAPLPVQVGTDGLMLVRRSRSWFVPYSSIIAFEQASDATLLRYADGRCLRLLNTRHMQLEEVTVSQLRALVLRYRHARDPGFSFPPLAGEPIIAWLEAIRATHTLDRETLLYAVENPASPASTRATAAVLLARDMTPHERACILLGAATTVSPGVARVLLASAENRAIVDPLRALEELLAPPPPVSRWRQVVRRASGFAPASPV